MEIGVIVIVIAIASSICFIFLTLITLVLFYCGRTATQANAQSHRETRTAKRDEPDIESDGGVNASFDPSIRQVSMSELVAATNNFHPSGIIGDGGFGLVYRAVLSSGTTVALKKLNLDGAFQGLREFRAEMETLASICHPNIVRILGFCVSGPDRVLIYEFVDRGSLHEWLHDTTSISDSSDPPPATWPLSWETRVKVVRGVAKGLAHMHGLEKPIIHRDIKAGNVLLDLDFEAHIADFGLARRIEGADSHLSTQAAGTMGYMPPEYRAGYTAATVKADVYSFGVLMFEVATGRRPDWPIKDDGLVRLVEWAKKKISETKEMEMVDESIPAKELRREAEVREFFRIASVCTNDMPEERPRMSNVVEMLNQIAM